jgi:hypothetical protein
MRCTPAEVVRQSLALLPSRCGEHRHTPQVSTLMLCFIAAETDNTATGLAAYYRRARDITHQLRHDWHRHGSLGYTIGQNIDTLPLCQWWQDPEAIFSCTLSQAHHVSKFSVWDHTCLDKTHVGWPRGVTPQVWAGQCFDWHEARMQHIGYHQFS